MCTLSNTTDLYSYLPEQFLKFFHSFYSRQKELEEKLIEEEVAKRVESLVAERVQQELERRKDEIEAEVMRRVEEAKRVMEKEMLEEMERKRQAEIQAQKQKEVKYCIIIPFFGYHPCTMLSFSRFREIGSHWWQDFAVFHAHEL